MIVGVRVHVAKLISFDSLYRLLAIYEQLLTEITFLLKCQQLYSVTVLVYY